MFSHRHSNYNIDKILDRLDRQCRKIIINIINLNNKCEERRYCFHKQCLVVLDFFSPILRILSEYQISSASERLGDLAYKCF